MAPLSTDSIASRAADMAKAGPPAGAVEELVAAAGGDRVLIEAARDQIAARLHRAPDDWDATATLTFLNRTLAAMPRNDPLDWRVRWSQRFRRP
jgi:hypothetical protein